MKKTLNHLVKIITAFFLFTIFMTFSAFWYFSSGLPDYKKLANYNFTKINYNLIIIQKI